MMSYLETQLHSPGSKLMMWQTTAYQTKMVTFSLTFDQPNIVYYVCYVVIMWTFVWSTAVPECSLQIMFVIFISHVF